MGSSQGPADPEANSMSAVQPAPTRAPQAAIEDASSEINAKAIGFGLDAGQEASKAVLYPRIVTNKFLSEWNQDLIKQQSRLADAIQAPARQLEAINGALGKLSSLAVQIPPFPVPKLPVIHTGIFEAAEAARKQWDGIANSSAFRLAQVSSAWSISLPKPWVHVREAEEALFKHMRWTQINVQSFKILDWVNKFAETARLGGLFNPSILETLAMGPSGW